MELGVVGALIAGFCVIVFVANNGRRTKRKQIVRNVLGESAQILGLTMSTSPGTAVALARGNPNGVTISIECVRTSDGERTRFRVKIPRLPPGMSIKAEGLGSSMGKALMGDDLQIGDPEFDSAILIRGPATATRSLMSQDARQAVMKAVKSGAKLEQRVLSVDRIGWMKDSADVVELAQKLIKAAECLEPGWTVSHDLMTNAKNDPLPAVRKANMEALFDEFPDSDDALSAAKKAMDDADPLIRLRGAFAAGDAGVPVLRNLAMISSRAVQELSRRGLWTYDELEVLLNSEHPQIRTAAVSVMSNVKDARVEGFLISILTNKWDPDTLAAIRAIGQVGSIKAVEPLLPYTEGFLAAPKLKEAARKAVSAIQERLGNVKGGRLTVAVAEQGRLSTAPVDGGVSLVPQRPKKQRDS